MAERLRIALTLSLSGPYAAMGRQAEAALRLYLSDCRASGGWRVGARSFAPELECHDDASDPARCAEIYRTLCAGPQPALILGPYSSRLTRAAAPIAEQAAMLFLNHGGAADDLYQNDWRMIVGVPSAASDYMGGLVRLLAALKLWRKRVAIVAPPTPFARAVADGLERAVAERYARRHGVRVRVRYNRAFDAESTPRILLPALARNRVNALFSAGSFGHDAAIMKAVASSPLNVPVLGCVAAGVARFRDVLGDWSEGIVGPSQWEEQMRHTPALGPTASEFARRMRAASTGAAPDYPAAQAYAAMVLAEAALRLAGAPDQQRMRTALSDLRSSTLYGDFQIDRITGRQVAHKVLLVQWHGGKKLIIEPEAHAETGSLDVPSGWRLILAGFQMFTMSRKGQGENPETRGQDEDDDDADRARDEKPAHDLKADHQNNRTRSNDGHERSD